MARWHHRLNGHEFEQTPADSEGQGSPACCSSRGLNESVFHIRWPKYWSFNFNISLSNEYSMLISFRIDWFGHFAFQGTLKSLLQHHSSKTSILRLSAIFMVQFSHLTTGKIIALTVWTFVGKVMSLIFKYTV